MIQGIDIFSPRENGLPDFSKITPAQIFNGSVAASAAAMKEKYPTQETSGVAESPFRNTTLNPVTGKREEVRKATVVEELLNGDAKVARGHRAANRSPRYDRSNEPSVGGSMYAEDNPGSPLPDLPGTQDSYMPEGYQGPAPPDLLPPPDAETNSLLPPIELSPPEQREASLRKLPTMLLDELKNLHLV